MFLFATNAEKDKCNEEMLFKQHSKSNPVAVIKTKTTNKHGAQIANSSKHFSQDRQILSKTNICRNAKVSLYGRNIKPEWGLYNGSQGVVKDIVYKPGESPNLGDQPEYVLVEFPQYKGPAFLEKFPKYVPIVPIQHSCDKFCCSQCFLPLKLSYARTIHTFQGSSAGPTTKGQQKNAIQRIICDPGNKEFELRNPGLFYTLLSRATTLGDKKNLYTSAIFFTGNNMNPSRLLNMTKTEKGITAKKVALRELWVELLSQNSHSNIMKQEDINKLFTYFDNTKIDTKTILAKFQL